MKYILAFCTCLAFAVPAFAKGHAAHSGHAGHSAHSLRAAGGNHMVRAHARRGHQVKAHRARNPRHAAAVRHPHPRRNAFRPG